MLNNIFKEENAEYVNKKNNTEIAKKIYQELINNNYEVLKQKKYDVLKNTIENMLINDFEVKNISYYKFYVDYIYNKMFGYDLVQKYIDRDDVTDIRLTKYDSIFIKSRGKWLKVEDKFNNENEFFQFVRCAIIKNGGKINYEKPVVIVSDKEYKLRIEVGIPPVNVIGPSMVIRIHRNTKTLTLDKLAEEHKMLTDKQLEKIKNAIINKSNIIISGKGGSGKTTLLRAIIHEIDEDSAITTNEETAELYIENKNAIQRTIISDREKEKNIDLELLTRQSLVMSNDFLVVGEIKRTRKFSISRFYFNRTCRLRNNSLK